MAEVIGSHGWRAGFAAVTGLRRARLDPGRDGARALAVVALAAVLLSSVLAWRCRPVVEAPAGSPTMPASASPAPVPP